MMSQGPEKEPCFSCGALVPRTDGPTHDYMLSSPGCWAIYGEVLAREYERPAYAASHRLTVDAYAVQHPGEATPAATRSVWLHLISLCAVLEHGVPQHRATRIIQRLADRDLDFEWLEPPGGLGEVTVADVYEADEPESHLAAVQRWARSAWDAWSGHHEAVKLRVDPLA